MESGKQIIIEALKKHSCDAMERVEEFRARAASQATKEEAELYLQQAQEEEAKARGYLKQAQILMEIEI